MRFVEEGLFEEGDILGRIERLMLNEFLNYLLLRLNLRVLLNCFKVIIELYVFDVIYFFMLYMKCCICFLFYSYR